MRSPMYKNFLEEVFRLFQTVSETDPDSLRFEKSLLSHIDRRMGRAANSQARQEALDAEMKPGDMIRLFNPEDGGIFEAIVQKAAPKTTQRRADALVKKGFKEGAYKREGRPGVWRVAKDINLHVTRADDPEGRRLTNQGTRFLGIVERAAEQTEEAPETPPTPPPATPPAPPGDVKLDRDNTLDDQFSLGKAREEGLPENVEGDNNLLNEDALEAGEDEEDGGQEYNRNELAEIDAVSKEGSYDETGRERLAGMMGSKSHMWIGELSDAFLTGKTEIAREKLDALMASNEGAKAYVEGFRSLLLATSPRTVLSNILNREDEKNEFAPYLWNLIFKDAHKPLEGDEHKQRAKGLVSAAIDRLESELDKLATPEGLEEAQKDVYHPFKLALLNTIIDSYSILKSDALARSRAKVAKILDAEQAKSDESYDREARRKELGEKIWLNADLVRMEKDFYNRFAYLVQTYQVRTLPTVSLIMNGLKPMAKMEELDPGTARAMVINRVSSADSWRKGITRRVNSMGKREMRNLLEDLFVARNEDPEGVKIFGGRKGRAARYMAGKNRDKLTTEERGEANHLIAEDIAAVMEKYFGNTGTPWNTLAVRSNPKDIGKPAQFLVGINLPDWSQTLLNPSQKSKSVLRYLRHEEGAPGLQDLRRDLIKGLMNNRPAVEAKNDPGGDLIDMVTRSSGHTMSTLSTTFKSPGRAGTRGKLVSASVSPNTQHQLNVMSRYISERLPSDSPLRRRLEANPMVMFGLHGGIRGSVDDNGFMPEDLGFSPELRAKIFAGFKHSGWTMMNPFGTKSSQILIRNDALLHDKEAMGVAQEFMEGYFAAHQKNAEQGDIVSKAILSGKIVTPLAEMTPESMASAMFQIMVNGRYEGFLDRAKFERELAEKKGASEQEQIELAATMIKEAWSKRGNQTNTGLLPIPGGLRVLVVDLSGSEYADLAKALDGASLQTRYLSKRFSSYSGGYLGRNNSEKDPRMEIHLAKAIGRGMTEDFFPMLQKDLYTALEASRPRRVDKAYAESTEWGNRITKLDSEDLTPSFFKAIDAISRANPDVDVISFNTNNFKLGTHLLNPMRLMNPDGSYIPGADGGAVKVDEGMILKYAEHEAQIVQMMSKSTEKRVKETEVAKQMMGNLLAMQSMRNTGPGEFLSRYMAEKSEAQLQNAGLLGLLDGDPLEVFLAKQLAGDSPVFTDTIRRALERPETGEVDGDGKPILGNPAVGEVFVPGMGEVVALAAARELRKTIRPQARRASLLAVSQRMGAGIRDYRRVGDGHVALGWSSHSAMTGRSADWWDRRGSADMIADIKADMKLSHPKDASRPRWMGNIDLYEFDAMMTFLRETFGEDMVGMYLKGGLRSKAANDRIYHTHRRFVEPGWVPPKGKYLGVDPHVYAKNLDTLNEGLRTYEFVPFQEVIDQLLSEGVSEDALSNLKGEDGKWLDGLVIPGAVTIPTRIPSDGSQSHPPVRHFLQLNDEAQGSITHLDIQLRKGADMDGDADYHTLMDVDKLDRIVLSANNLMLMAVVASVDDAHLVWWGADDVDGSKGANVDDMKAANIGIAERMRAKHGRFLRSEQVPLNDPRWVDRISELQALSKSLGIAAHLNMTIPFAGLLDFSLSSPILPFGEGEQGGTEYLQARPEEGAEGRLNLLNTIKTWSSATYVNAFVDALNDTDIFDFGLIRSTVPLFLSSLVRTAPMWTAEYGSNPMKVSAEFQDTAFEILDRMASDPVWVDLRKFADRYEAYSEYAPILDGLKRVTLPKEMMVRDAVYSIVPQPLGEDGFGAEWSRIKKSWESLLALGLDAEESFVESRITTLLNEDKDPGTQAEYDAKITTLRSLLDIADRHLLSQEMQNISKVVGLITGDLNLKDTQALISTYRLAVKAPNLLGRTFSSDSLNSGEAHKDLAKLHPFLGALPTIRNILESYIHRLPIASVVGEQEIKQGLDAYIAMIDKEEARERLRTKFDQLFEKEQDFSRWVQDIPRTVMDAAQTRFEARDTMARIESLAKIEGVELDEFTMTRSELDDRLADLRERYPDNPLVDSLTVEYVNPTREFTGKGRMGKVQQVTQQIVEFMDDDPYHRIRISRGVTQSWIQNANEEQKQELQRGFEELDLADRLSLLRDSQVWAPGFFKQPGLDFASLTGRDTLTALYRGDVSGVADEFMNRETAKYADSKGMPSIVSQVTGLFYTETPVHEVLRNLTNRTRNMPYDALHTLSSELFQARKMKSANPPALAKKLWDVATRAKGHGAEKARKRADARVRRGIPEMKLYDDLAAREGEVTLREVRDAWDQLKVKIDEARAERDQGRVESLKLVHKELLQLQGRVKERMRNSQAADLGPRASVDISNVFSYRGLNVDRTMTDKKHPVHGGLSPASLITLEDGSKVIRINRDELIKTFEAKQWTAPRTPGITALPTDAFATLGEWAAFALEHEYQHTRFPSVPRTDAEAYVKNENAINRAAAEALGIADKLYPARGPGFVPTVSARVPQAEKVKAPFKAALATKYIGFGERSTGQYRVDAEAARIPVNSEEYGPEDVVFVSVNGQPTDANFNETARLAILALDAGATLLTDSEEYLARSTYNQGERALAEALTEAEYQRTTHEGNENVATWKKVDRSIGPMKMLRFPVPRTTIGATRYNGHSAGDLSIDLGTGYSMSNLEYHGVTGNFSADLTRKTDDGKATLIISLQSVKKASSPARALQFRTEPGAGVAQVILNGDKAHIILQKILGEKRKESLDTLLQSLQDFIVQNPKDDAKPVAERLLGDWLNSLTSDGEQGPSDMSAPLSEVGTPDDIAESSTAPDTTRYTVRGKFPPPPPASDQFSLGTSGEYKLYKNPGGAGWIVDTGEVSYIIADDVAKEYLASEEIIAEDPMAEVPRYPEEMLSKTWMALSDGTKVRASIDQAQALDTLTPLVQVENMRSGRSELLLGPAGTGKTALLHEIARRARFMSGLNYPVFFATPTARAGEVLRSSVSYRDNVDPSILKTQGKRVYTLESFFRASKVGDDFRYPTAEASSRDRNFQFHPVAGLTGGGLLIIDEASMVDTEEIKTIKDFQETFGFNVLFVGDTENQLLPIEESSTPVTEFVTTPVNLDLVMRQAGTSPLLDTLTVARMNRRFDPMDLRTKVNLETGEGIVVVKALRNKHVLSLLRNMANLTALERNPALIRAVIPLDKLSGQYHDVLWSLLFRGEETPEVLHHPLLRVGGILIGQNTNNRGGDDAQTGTKNGVEYRVESVGEVKPRDLRQEILGMLKEEMTGKKATFKRKEIYPRLRDYVESATKNLGTVDAVTVALRPVNALPGDKNITTSALVGEAYKTYAALMGVFDSLMKNKVEQFGGTLWDTGAGRAIKDIVEEVSARYTHFENREAARKKNNKLPQWAVPNLAGGLGITVHKAQGGTYKVVIIDMNDIRSFARNDEEKFRLLYTALSRASHLAIIVDPLASDEHVVNAETLASVQLLTADPGFSQRNPPQFEIEDSSKYGLGMPVDEVVGEAPAAPAQPPAVEDVDTQTPQGPENFLFSLGRHDIQENTEERHLDRLAAELGLTRTKLNDEFQASLSTAESWVRQVTGSYTFGNTREVFAHQEQLSLYLKALGRDRDRQAHVLERLFNTTSRQLLDPVTGKPTKKNLTESELDFLKKAEASITALMQLYTVTGADDTKAWIQAAKKHRKEISFPMGRESVEVATGEHGRRANPADVVDPFEIAQAFDAMTTKKGDRIEVETKILKKYEIESLAETLTESGRKLDLMQPLLLARKHRADLDEVREEINRLAKRAGLKNLVPYASGFIPVGKGIGLPTQGLVEELQGLEDRIHYRQVSPNDTTYDPLRVTDTLFDVGLNPEPVHRGILGLIREIEDSLLRQNGLSRADFVNYREYLRTREDRRDPNTREYPKYEGDARIKLFFVPRRGKTGELDTMSELFENMVEEGAGQANVIHQLESILGGVNLKLADQRNELEASDTFIEASSVLRQYMKRVRTASHRYSSWHSKNVTRKEGGTNSTLMSRFVDGTQLYGTLNPARMVADYVQDLSSVLVTHSLLSTSAVSKGHQGEPVLFVVPPAGDVDDLWNANPAILRTMLRNAEDYTGVKTNVKSPLNDRLREMSDVLMTMHGKYEIYESPATGAIASRMVYRVDTEGRWGLGPNLRASLKKLFDQKMSRTYLGGRRDVMEDWYNVTQFAKFMNLSLSVFFALSAVESYTASSGMRGLPGLLWDGLTLQHPIKRLRDLNRQLRSGDMDADLAADMQRYGALGLNLDTTFDATMVDLSVGGNILKWTQYRAATSKTAAGRKSARMASKVLGFQNGLTKWMFEDLFPTLKFDATRKAVERMEELKGDKLSDSEMREIMTTMNAAFGGQQWASYWWATPKFMQGLSLLLFAPNWTLSSFNIAGGQVLMDKLGLGPKTTSLTTDFMTKVYWPAMVSYVVAGWPNALQAMFAAAGAGLGGDDDDEKEPDDTWFSVNNERGREFHVDITPLARLMPWFHGGDNANRRVYMRWGKQVWEVFDPERSWTANWWNTAQGKMSTPVRAVVGQITGDVPGVDGWAYDFKDAGFMGLFRGETEGFAGSRLAVIAQSFTPFSVSQLADAAANRKNRDGFPFNLLGPVSKGATKSKLTAAMAKVLRTYANDAAFDDPRTAAASHAGLVSLSSAITRSIEANGYQAEAVVNDARKRILSDLYKDFTDAMEAGDEARMEKHARSIIRVQGSLSAIHRSIKTRARQGNYDLGRITPENLQLAQEAFSQAWGLPTDEPAP